LNLMSDLRSKNVEFCRLMLPVHGLEDHIQMKRTKLCRRLHFPCCVEQPLRRST
jgi:hypothetical protein